MGAQPIVWCRCSSAQPEPAPSSRLFADLVLHELTDLPDDLEDLPAESLLNARIRVEGTRNLIDAMNGLETGQDRRPKRRVDDETRT